MSIIIYNKREIEIYDYYKHVYNSMPPTEAERLARLESMEKTLNCFLDEEDVLAFDATKGFFSKKPTIFFISKIKGYPYFNKKRRTQRWYFPTLYNELNFGLGFDYICAIIKNKEGDKKVKYVIRACEGLDGPNYLRILNRSGDDFVKRVLPELKSLLKEQL